MKIKDMLVVHSFVWFFVYNFIYCKWINLGDKTHFALKCDAVRYINNYEAILVFHENN